MATNLIYTPSDGEISAIKGLTNDARADLAARINSTSPFSLFDSVEGKEGKQIICPNCGSGSGKNRTGVTPTYENGKWIYNCFACGGFHGDLISIIADANNLSTNGTDFFSVLAIAAKVTGQNIFGGNVETATKTTQTTKKEKPVAQVAVISPQLQNLIVADIEEGKANFEKLPSKEKRGLTDETLKTFQIGVIFNWTPPQNRLDNQNLYPSPRVIIPHLTSSALPNIPLTYCAALFLSERETLESQGKTFLKYLYGGNRTPFGLNTLKPADKLFAVEGEYDALSIWQATGGLFPCLATGGTAFNGIFDALEGFYTENKPVIYFLADNDNAGKNLADKFCNAAKEKGFIAVAVSFAPLDAPKSDANKILIEQGNSALADKINSLIEGAQGDLDNAAAEKKAFESQELAFIPADKRNDFIKLRRQAYSKQRNDAMILIIRDSLDWKTNKQGKRLYILPTAANFRRIFNTDPVLAKLFAYEAFKEEIVFLRQPIWQKPPRVNQTLTDSDDSAMRNYLRENYTENFKDSVVADMLTDIAHLQSFNIVKQWLENLPKWDGTPRAETLFVKFLNVADSEYTRQVTFKWLLAAISRIYFSGCNFQAALVLQGEQNIGKSYILEKLGGDFYGTLISNVDDTHAVDEIRGIWICEMKEMSAMRKADVNAQKAFIERAADTYRAAYARRAQKFPRHCVFAITVNDIEFLRDTTGNRRYWILQSSSKEFEIKTGLTDEYVQQIWAEVLFHFKELTADGFNSKILDLPLDLKIFAEKIAAEFTVDDGLQGEIAAFLDIPIPPPVIWKLLTKDEKRSFFKNSSITFDESEWLTRKTTYLIAAERQEFDAIFEDGSYIRRIEIPRGRDNFILQIAIYGSVQRQETCAAEIYNEFFSGSDKRRLISKINGILPKLDDWILQSGQRWNFNGYGNQKKIYRRRVVVDAVANVTDKITIDDEPPLPF